MAFDAYMKIDSIPGEATDKDHKGWIQLQSFDHNVMQPHDATQGIGASGGRGRGEVSDITFTKLVDKATPLLFLRCCDGQNLQTVKINVVRQVDKKLEYMKYELTNTTVSAVTVSAGGDVTPIESGSLNFTKIKHVYTPVKPDNTPDTEVQFDWDKESGTGTGG
jgi:type VI secretion system secreted protein Hcp